MKKSDFWDLVWIPVSRRRPPEDREKIILIWNPIWKQPMTMQSSVALYSLQGIENKEQISNDRIFSHWCEPGPPKRRDG